MFFFVFCLFAAVKFSSSCITKQECVTDVAESLHIYDQRYVALEHKLAEILHKHTDNLAKEIKALNSAMLRGPDRCQDFLEDSLEHYISMINESCNYDKHPGVPKQVWAQFTDLDPGFFYRIEAEKVDKICDLMVLVLNNYCSRLQEEIAGLKACDFVASFKTMFVRPWKDCVALHHKRR